MDNHNQTHNHSSETGFKTYQPLVVIIASILLASLALQQAGLSLMSSFMGLFFIVFAMFKLFDINGFADGFQTYDIIAKPWRGYAYLYPFMELILGLVYLAHIHHSTLHIATLALMSVSAIGVIKSLLKGQKIKCACLGTMINVPLSTISAIENIGMGAMALYMLIG